MQSEIEIMRVLRVPPMGKLVVNFNENRFEAISDIPEENVRQLIRAAIGELITFAGGYQNLVDAGVAPPLTSTQPQATTSENEEAQRFLSRMEEERDALKSSARLQQPPSVFTNLRWRPATTESSANKMLSLVEQVDEILQRHLESDPELAQRSIHLVQDTNGGLIIEVDGHRYERPREIDDPRIQLMIKRALKEWEAS
ncbi:hypothetical protein [Candidatus Leptofilum sp.]|uniref:hypothetical protein n=1 Tax=Candidatus Leptofilum sp. TaxID=3241576 RepID=UPI003B5C8071